MATAHALAKLWPNAQLHIIPDAGHMALEPGITDAIIRATESFVGQ
jgi:proline iminopeptidase